MLDLCALYRQGRITVEIRRFPLDEAPQVWDRILTGMHYKALIEP